MTDKEMLKQKIHDSGYRIYFIAEKCGITYQGLLNKIENKSYFNAYEINVLKNLLKLTPEEAESIFFADKVDKMSTEVLNG